VTAWSKQLKITDWRVAVSAATGEGVRQFGTLAGQLLSTCRGRSPPLKMSPYFAWSGRNPISQSAVRDVWVVEGAPSSN